MTERKRALRYLASVEKDLREMADGVAREIKYATDEGRELFPEDRHPLVFCAEQVIHNVTWGLANLSLGSMMSACFDAAKAEEIEE